MARNSVAEIRRIDLEDLDLPDSASITGVRQLSSYNWIEAPKNTPTIAVPGSPDLWSSPNEPLLLDKDTGHFYIAQNAARHPDYPLEPLFRALYVSRPSFDIGSIDVVTDRSNIRKLLAFVNPRSSKYKREKFTINIEVVKNTAVFCRDETATSEYIGPNEDRGYGHTFEKTYTARQVNGSTGHHRIVSYRFGGLNFLLRHETDGYVGSADQKLLPTDGQMREVDDLSSDLVHLSLSPPNSSKGNIQPAGSKLLIRKVGRVIPLDSTLEIKTRVARRPLGLSEVLSQLWISQTPKLVRAYHTKGLFALPKVEDVAAEIKTWEACNQKDLRRLAGLIRKIRDVARDKGGRAVLRYDAMSDKLILRKLRRKLLLPKDLYLKMGGGG
jgi:hypothetical protein